MKQTNAPTSTKTEGQWPGQKVISLIRVSTPEQAGDWKAGVTRQRDANQLAEKMVGLPIESETLAIDVSGRHVRQDPQFKKLFADLKRPDIAGIYVAEHSRLFRPEFGADYAILDEFANAKKRIWVRGQMIEPWTDEGNMSLVMNGLMSGRELRLIKQRMKEGRDKARRQGRNAQGPKSLPAGVSYHTERAVGGDLTWRYELDPNEVTKIKLAFRMLLDGYSYEQIAEKTGRASGCLPRTLRNPIWVGKRQYIYRASDKEYMSPSGKLVRRSILRDDPYEVELFGAGRLTADGPVKLKDFPRVISDEMFERAKQIMTERSTQWRKAKLKHSARRRPLLTGIGRCKCGAILHYQFASKKPEWDRYNCATRHDRKRHQYCGADSALCHVIDKAVVDMVTRDLSNPRFIQQNAERVMSLTTADPQKTARERQLKAIEPQRARINDMFEEGRIEKADYIARLKRLDMKKRELEASTPAVPETVTPKQIAAEIAQSFADFNLEPWEKQRDMLMKRFRDITIDPANGGSIASVTLKQRFCEHSDEVISPSRIHTRAGKNSVFPSDIRLTLARAS